MINRSLNIKSLLIGGCIVLLSVIGYLIMHYLIPHMETKKNVLSAARIAKSRDLQDGYCFTDLNDAWGKPICIRREVADGGKAIGYMSISAGRDGLYGTEDDYQALKIDLNKSKIIGEYVGKRVVRMWDGFKQGVVSPDKFEEETVKDTKRTWKFWKWKKKDE